MPRMVLSLVLSLAVLVPPGFCICRLTALLPCHEATSTAADDEPSPPCPCCRHRHAPPGDAPALTRTGPVSDDSHAPGCPARPGHVVTKAPLLELLLPACTLADVGFWLTPRWAGPLEHPGGPAEPASVPLFLRCCALRC